jgi:hypothetical protein
MGGGGNWSRKKQVFFIFFFLFIFLPFSNSVTKTNYSYVEKIFGAGAFAPLAPTSYAYKRIISRHLNRTFETQDTVGAFIFNHFRQRLMNTLFLLCYIQLNLKNSNKICGAKQNV